MSTEIFYDRAFIRVGDRFVPLVNHGSSNTYQHNCSTGRDVREKNWNVLNWKRWNQLLFSADEIRELARDYDLSNQSSGCSGLSRYVIFKAGEFECWIINGMRHAYTVEEYVSFGNSPYILDDSAANSNDKKFYPFSTEGEFLDLLEKLKGSRELSVKFENRREVYRPVKKRAQRTRPDYRGLQEYFVLSHEHSVNKVCYFSSISPWKIRFVFDPHSSYVRSFPSEQKAQKYLDQYPKRLEGFQVEKIVNTPESQASIILLNTSTLKARKEA